MSIIYTLVAKDKLTILVEELSAKGNFPSVTQTILEKIESETQCSYKYDENYLYHYINKDGLTFLCLADATYKISFAFEFLKKLQLNFLFHFSKEQIKNANAFSLDSFKGTIEKNLEFYNSDEKVKIKRTIKEFEMVKQGMVINVDDLLKKEEKVELMILRNKNLNPDIIKQGNRIQAEQKWKTLKTKITGILILIVIFYILFSTFCGGLSLSECF